ncbi:hypothetical protein SAY87_005649 [Trapa incisa]|uniref:Uncharacterized protein n=1 Tax=Trapa incisa TaxID=236973 RepID=A0AAN7Q6U8_9MYRT|nr:hypothetical protein SAY87_005649 [Trapa incisa]
MILPSPSSSEGLQPDGGDKGAFFGLRWSNISDLQASAAAIPARRVHFPLESLAYESSVKEAYMQHSSLQLALAMQVKKGTSGASDTHKKEQVLEAVKCPLDEL